MEQSPMSVKDHEECPFIKPHRLNAFQIISLYTEFNLFGMFEKEKNAEFTTKTPRSIVVAKLEEIAQLDGRFKVIKQNGILILEEIETRINEQLIIDTNFYFLTNFYEISSSCYIVEANKIAGDVLEYRKFLDQFLKPSLNEILARM
jgi:hypothetical protein